ncbi:hypothetical protein BKA80DRAFT_277503 [Phyllosticta citrichinensis]
MPPVYASSSSSLRPTCIFNPAGTRQTDRQRPSVVEKVCTAASSVLPHHTTPTPPIESIRTSSTNRPTDQPLPLFSSRASAPDRWLASTCPSLSTTMHTLTYLRFLRLVSVDYCMRVAGTTQARHVHTVPTSLPACCAATGRGGWEPLRLGLVRLGQAELDTERRRRMCCGAVQCDAMASVAATATAWWWWWWWGGGGGGCLVAVCLPVVPPLLPPLPPPSSPAPGEVGEAVHTRHFSRHLFPLYLPLYMCAVVGLDAWPVMFRLARWIFSYPPLLFPAMSSSSSSSFSLYPSDSFSLFLLFRCWGVGGWHV